MSKGYKYTGTDDAYQCPDCNDWHISDYAISKLPWHIRVAIKLRLIRL